MMKTTHPLLRTLTLALSLCALIALTACSKATPEATSSPTSAGQEANDSPQAPTEAKEAPKGEVDEGDQDDDEAEDPKGIGEKEEAGGAVMPKTKPSAPRPSSIRKGSSGTNAPAAAPKKGEKGYREEFGVE